MLCNIYSHPNVLLKEHLKQVSSFGNQLFEENKIFSEYHNIIRCALIMHDIGKAHPDFQKKIKGLNHHEIHHAPVSAQWTYFLLKELKNSDLDSFIGFYIVYLHHSSLKYPRENGAFEDTDKVAQELDYSEFESISRVFIQSNKFLSKDNYEKLKEKYQLINVMKRRTFKQVSSEHYYIINYLFSLLIYADKKAAIFNDKAYSKVTFSTWKADIVDNYKSSLSFPESELNSMRQKLYYECISKPEKFENKILSINMPTGTGKTFTALNVALKIKNLYKHKKRIIYCLPFTSVIEQNATIFEKILKSSESKIDNSMLLKQHHLVEYNYVSQSDFTENESKFLIESWESEVVVTTFYQLLNTLISGTNKRLVKLANLAHSVIILDEVQAIPARYWKLINNVITTSAKLYDIHFVLATATMPLIFSKEKDEIVELATSYKECYSKLDRITLNCSKLNSKITLDELAEFIVADAEKVNSQLVILNSIGASILLYNILKEIVPHKEILYLSTNIIPLQRENIIEEIRQNPNNKIVISTQVVEAGVDIDIDKVYRDLAPLDSIFQACGRCNRNSVSKKGEVEVIELVTVNNKPYWSFIYDQSQVEATRAILQKRVIKESEFNSLAEQYYSKIHEYLNNNDSDELIEAIHKLKYEDLTNDFKLIKDIPKFSAFIALDENANNLLDEYNTTLNTKSKEKFVRLTKLQSIRKKMSKYIVSLPKKFEISTDETFTVINTHEVAHYYNEVTGFKRKLNQEDFIF